MLSDYAAFAASPYTTHAGAFQPSTARRPTASWLAMRDAYSPCTEQTSPLFMRAFLTAPPSARSRAAGTTRRARIARTACGKSPRATGGCWPSLRWHSRSPRPIGNSRASASLLTCLFGRVIVPGSDTAVGFAALESTGAGDRVIGAVAYAPTSRENADFCIAVAHTHREEQVGRTLLATLLRHARRVGVPQLAAEMLWSNRPMQMLAMSMGFAVEPLARDRTLRRLVLSLK